MREGPILMNEAMVRATLRDVDPKTQTRRILKLPPWVKDEARAIYELREMAKKGEPPGLAEYVDGRPVRRFVCPYWQGRRLWVRETWGTRYATVPLAIAAGDIARMICYRATEPDAPVGRWVPSIHMPRSASRINLEIAGLKIERLLDISEDDARAEGVTLEPQMVNGVQVTPGTHKGAFLNLWSQINGEESVAENLMVWAVSFRRVKESL